MNDQPKQPERTDEEVPATSPRPAGRLPGQWYTEAEDGTPVAPEPSMAAQGIPIAAGLTPISGEPTTGFSVHAGEVIVSPRVFAIYWGRDYGSPATGMNALATSLDSFIAMLLGSRYFDMMGEYLVGRGAFIGSTWIDHSPSISKTYTQDDMRDLLIHWIDDGVTPEVPSWDDRESRIPHLSSRRDNADGIWVYKFLWLPLLGALPQFATAEETTCSLAC